MTVSSFDCVSQTGPLAAYYKLPLNRVVVVCYHSAFVFNICT